MEPRGYEVVIMSSRKGWPVVIAGAGFAAACAALRLLATGFSPVLLRSPQERDLAGIEILPAAMAHQLAVLGLGDALVRADASPAEGMDARWGRSDDGLRPYRSLHVDRLALRREALSEAAARGAEIRTLARPPAAPAACDEAVECAGERFFAALDATGRRAVWVRPILRLGRTSADIFAVATTAFSDVARVSRLADGWTYAAGSGAEATLGIISDGPRRAASSPDKIWHALLVPGPSPIRRLGRRPAFPQYALAPVRGRVLAIGDAAFAHNPIAGRGLAFALGSALAAATTIASWRSRPADFAVAAAYYEEYVAAERRHHLAFLASLDSVPTPLAGLVDPDHTLSWCATVADAPLAFPEGIRSELAVVLRDGGPVRWLGNFDLLALRNICAVPLRPEALFARLCALGLGDREATLLLSWAVQHGVLGKTGADCE
jgi:flavin-dependent dehydrogenase